MIASHPPRRATVTSYACPCCHYHGPADVRAWFGDDSGIATATWRRCAECGADLTRHDRLDDDTHPCEVCEHAIGHAGTTVCHTCRIADALDDAICESRAARAVTDQTIAVIRDFTLTPFRAVSP